jgi:hypothetical protein
MGILFYPKKIKVIVNLKSGKSMRGFIWKHNPDYLILKNVELLESADAIYSLDGEVLIYHNDIDFIQIL